MSCAYCGGDHDTGCAVDECRQRLVAQNRELVENINYLLDHYPGAVRCREGAGHENLAASLAISWQKMQSDTMEAKEYCNAIFDLMRTLLPACDAKTRSMLETAVARGRKMADKFKAIFLRAAAEDCARHTNAPGVCGCADRLREAANRIEKGEAPWPD